MLQWAQQLERMQVLPLALRQAYQHQQLLEARRLVVRQLEGQPVLPQGLLLEGLLVPQRPWAMRQMQVTLLV